MPSRIMDEVSANVVAVVLNWNGWSDTIACLESLLDADRKPDTIVVCDNGSLDDSIERITEWAHDRMPSYAEFSSVSAAFDTAKRPEPLVVIAIGENRGYAGGNNVGLRYALERCSADFVWILNGDVIADRGALREMLCVAAKHPRAGMIGSKLLRHDAPETIQAVGGGYILPVLCHDTQLGAGKPANSVDGAPLKLDHLVGASLLVRKDAIADVGPIDESYFLYREETDWCIRMRRAGWELRCATHAVLWHKQCHSVGFKSPIHDYYAVRNMLMLVRKMYPVWLPTAFGYFALRSILPKLVRMESLRLRAVLRAFGDFVRGKHGRCAAHTEEVLLRNYVSRNPETLLRAQKRRTIAVASLLALVFALAGAAAGRAVSTMWWSPSASIVVAHAPHGRRTQ